MDLILWRHAEAEEGDQGDPDMERRLTASGHKHAARMAAWLTQRLPSKLTLIASPARRTVQTAEALRLDFKTDARLAPGASVNDILETVRWPGRKGLTIVVGHQPTLGLVVARLVGGRDLDWPMRKGGLWWLADRERGGAEQVIVRAVIAPDLL